jgi:hypothetical protein
MKAIVGYGDDPLTQSPARVENLFGEIVKPGLPLRNGKRLALQNLMKPYPAVFCAGNGTQTRDEMRCVQKQTQARLHPYQLLMAS